MKNEYEWHDYSAVEIQLNKQTHKNRHPIKDWVPSANEKIYPKKRRMITFLGHSKERGSSVAFKHSACKHKHHQIDRTWGLWNWTTL